ncbi:FecR family protein [Mariniflexile sp. HMF6888]|uniref:FecR family protein n=1 Tax=Mariniflexile sp. HMF6888 TaxID=3373086 RepID=UPI0037AD000B
MKKTIIKYLNDTLSDLEYQELLFWLRKPENKKKFTKLVKENYDLNVTHEEIDDHKALNKVKMAIEKHKKASRHIVWRYAAAAIIVGISAGTYILKGDIFSSFQEVPAPIIVNNQIEPGNEKATLTLETGETVALEKGNTYETQNATSNGKEIIYHAGEKSKSEIAYNTLTIPRGGKFYIMLSDGTKVWLNSESQLKYPVAFNDGQLRQVELVYGEAYFEVSHSTEHKGSHFKVMHNQHEVEVLGTEFNIKAYKEETNIYTTLVKGKVEVSFENQRKILRPEEQSNLNTITGVLNVVNVDVYDQTSWKEGVFSFKRKTLKEIMQVLSRWYDMKVVFENKDLESTGFNGVVGKEQSIQEILQTIKNLGVIKNYEINNKTITLK